MISIKPTLPQTGTQFAVKPIDSISFDKMKEIAESTINLDSFENNLKIKTVYQGTTVKIHGGSLRLNIFLRELLSTGNMECRCCGKKAKHYVLDQKPFLPENTPVLELVSEENEIFTHDHVLARRLGGKDSPENCVIMCSTCNNIKNNQFETKGIAVSLSELQGYILNEQMQNRL